MRSTILGLPVRIFFPGFNSRSGGTLRYPVVGLVLCLRAVSIRAHTRVQNTTVGRAVKQLYAPRWMRYSSFSGASDHPQCFGPSPTGVGGLWYRRPGE